MNNHNDFLKNFKKAMQDLKAKVTAKNEHDKKLQNAFNQAAIQGLSDITGKISAIKAKIEKILDTIKELNTMSLGKQEDLSKTQENIAELMKVKKKCEQEINDINTSHKREISVLKTEKEKLVLENTTIKDTNVKAEAAGRTNFDRKKQIEEIVHKNNEAIKKLQEEKAETYEKYTSNLANARKELNETLAELASNKQIKNDTTSDCDVLQSEIIAATRTINDIILSFQNMPSMDNTELNKLVSGTKSQLDDLTNIVSTWKNNGDNQASVKQLRTTFEKNQSQVPPSNVRPATGGNKKSKKRGGYFSFGIKRRTSSRNKRRSSRIRRTSGRRKSTSTNRGYRSLKR
tara:strand:+ start:878 stop:1915 length:1038 start_codon:yes stop_codon:yes gene_type:complete